MTTKFEQDLEKILYNETKKEYDRCLKEMPTPEEAKAQLLTEFKVRIAKIPGQILEMRKQEPWSIIEKYWENKPKTEAEIKELFKATCWGDIGYCCGADKGCLQQNMIRQILGITNEEYTKQKEDFGMQMAKKAIQPFGKI
jgi:hypothetical protein